MKDQNMNQNNETTKTIELPKPINHYDQSYSLENDMILGWVPNVNQDEIVHVQFLNELNDQIKSQYQQKDPNKIIYIGYRPILASQFHQEYKSQTNYICKPLKNLTKSAILNNLQFTGMNPKSQTNIKFNSNFEGGNLDLVIQKSEQEFDLYMRVDTNTKGHTLWYYFEISGLASYDEIKLNICNFRKKRCLYERGMKPYIERPGQEWQQEGNNVKFFQYKHQLRDIKKSYYCLSFTIDNQKKDDQMKVAYCIPYTYSQLNKFISTLTQKYIDKSFFCYSLSGVSIQKLTFSKGSILDKKVIIVQARVHPGESNSSWVMQGLLEYLSSSQGEQLLDQLIFVIVPMLNVDGVIFGNYRTGCAGKDLNRQFREDQKNMFPTVCAMKQLISDLHQLYGNQVLGFIDIHGHSAKKNAFIYGPEFQLWNPNYYKSRLFAKILQRKTQIFRYYSCIFRINKCKINTARAVFCEKYDFINCFTLEVSNSSYYFDQTTDNFTQKHWIQFGHVIGESFQDFIQHYIEMENIFNNIKEKKMNKSQRRKGNSEMEEKQQQLQLICQNSKYSSLFNEMKNDQPDISFSEGESDSERSSDDYEKETLQEIIFNPKKQQRIKRSLKLSEEKKSPIRTEFQTEVKTKLIANKKQFLEDYINIGKVQNTNQQIYRKSSYKSYNPQDKNRDSFTYTLASKPSDSRNIKTYRATFIGGQQTKIEEIGNYSVTNKSPIKLKTLITQAQQRTKVEINSELKEENMADQIFQPYIKPKRYDERRSPQSHIPNSQNSPIPSQNSVNTVLTQCGLKSSHFPTDYGNVNYTVTTVYHGLNHPQKKPYTYKYNKNQKFQNNQNPSITLRNTLQMQKLDPQEDSIGILIKPKLFSSPQIDENLHMEGTKSAMNSYMASSVNSKTQKQQIPSSFYSIKKHWTNSRGMQQLAKIGV